MKSNLLPFILPLFAYLWGSIPFGWVIGKVFYNKDIRKGGSGNVGATNALRLYGTTTGIIVLLLDMAKGFIATQLAISLMPSGSPIVALCALLVILGHVFPLYLGFKGGKGVATAGGAFLALAPLSMLFALGVFIIVTFISRYVSMGSIIAAVTFLVHSLWQMRLAEKADYASLIFVTLVVLMIVIKHRENLVRLVEGTEHKIIFTRKGKG
ncbi:MAG: glycerol-3-phosphate 1-O-acyltransferase PlsY [Candidatus Cloacimonetes bacterium]|nr:glycerol-3-phosphate 1-O-acyltransferase PlsY [Candidatus Cloacimonadota bacterium]